MYLPSKTNPYLDVYLVLLPLLYLLYVTACALPFSFLLLLLMVFLPFFLFKFFSADYNYVPKEKNKKKPPRFAIIIILLANFVLRERGVGILLKTLYIGRWPFLSFLPVNIYMITTLCHIYQPDLSFS